MTTKVLNIKPQKLKKSRLIPKQDEFDDVNDIYHAHIENYDTQEESEVIVHDHDEDEEPIEIKIPDKKEIKIKIKEEKKKFYVDPKRMDDLIFNGYYKTGIISDELATYMYNIATRIAYAPNFINYTWREEMVGDSIIKLILALKNKKFDSTKGSSFSYSTKIVYNAFKNRIKVENKEHKIIKDLQQDTYDTLTTQHKKITTNDPDDT